MPPSGLPGGPSSDTDTDIPSPEELQARREEIQEDYWANKTGSELANLLYDKVEKFQTAIVSLPQFRRWLRGHTYYFGVSTSENPWDATDTASAGQDGELVSTRDGTICNIGHHIWNLATAEKLTFKTKPVNGDFASQATNQIADPVLEHYMDARGGSNAVDEAVNQMVPYGDSYVAVEWDQTKGRAWKKDPDTGSTVNEGDVVYKVIPPMRMVVDLWSEKPEVLWRIYAEQHSKRDIAVQYIGNPDYDTICTMQDSGFLHMNQNFFRTFTAANIANSDLITVYTFYHERTPACPDGRFAKFLQNGILLESGPLPYDEVQIYRVSAEDVPGTTIGASPLHTVLGLAPLIDDAISSVVTSMEMASVPNIVAPEGSTMDKSMVEGANFITVPASNSQSSFTPTIAKFDHLNPGTVEVIKMLVHQAETNSGVGAVIRGNPQESLKSGNSLALMSAQSVQYATPTIRARAEVGKKVAMATIRTLRRYAKSPRVLSIVGKDGEPYSKEWSAENLTSVDDNVDVEEIGPVAKTIAGRQNIADTLFNRPGSAPLITIPQYFEVLETGRLKQVTKGPVSDELVIQHENEMLRMGVAPAVFPLEDHSEHIKGHVADFLNIKTMLDPGIQAHMDVVNSYMDHIKAHVGNWRSLDPDLLLAMGRQPLPDGAPPMGMQPQGPPGPPGPPPPGPPPPPGAHPPGPPSVQKPPPGRIGNGAVVQTGHLQPGNFAQPSMPKIAGTNTPFTPGAGPNGAPPQK